MLLNVCSCGFLVKKNSIFYISLSCKLNFLQSHIECKVLFPSKEKVSFVDKLNFLELDALLYSFRSV